MGGSPGWGSALYVRDRTLLSRWVGRRLLVLASTGDVRELEGSGPVLWELLADPIGYDELVDLLGEVYGEPAGRIDADLAPLLVQFEDLGIVSRVPAP